MAPSKSPLLLIEHPCVRRTHSLPFRGKTLNHHIPVCPHHQLNTQPMKAVTETHWPPEQRGFSKQDPGGPHNHPSASPRHLCRRQGQPWKGLLHKQRGIQLCAAESQNISVLPLTIFSNSQPQFSNLQNGAPDSAFVELIYITVSLPIGNAV